MLAAGRSARMGSANKLLLDLGGEPVLARTLRLARHGPFADVVVVTGHERERVETVAGGFRTVHATDWREGMGASLRAGVAALDPDLDGVAMLLGDVPLIRSSTLDALAAAFAEAEAPAIVRPVVEGRPGHPVLFARAFRPDLLALGGDEGAQSVLRAHADRLVRLDTDDIGVTLDADTPAALDRLRQRLEALP